MSMLRSVVSAGCLAWSLAACSGPLKPVLPDGLHRVPVNRMMPVPDVPASEQPVPAVPPSQNLPASSVAGGRS